MEKQQLEALLKEMSLEEKVGQLFQIIGYYYVEEGKKFITGPDSGLNLSDENGALTGSVLGLQGAELVKDPERIYGASATPYPSAFMMDVIHGMKTIFPAPLAQAATFEPELTKEGSEIAAKEATAAGLHVAFSPMADLVRDPDGGEWWNLSERIRISVPVL